MQLFSSKHFFTKMLVFLSRNRISRIAKHFCVVDLDSRSQNAIFFFQAFFTKILMFSLKNGISRSAKQFHKVDLDLWGQNTIFFFQAFFDNNFDVFVKIRHFTKC
jgi:hypothetical protein